MGVKNPQIVEEILKADAEKKMSLIRENAETLTVSDLNEISIRLIENLTDSMKIMEKETDTVAAQTKLAKVASSKKQSERRLALQQMEADEIEQNVNIVSPPKAVVKTPMEQLEIDNYEDILDEELAKDNSEATSDQEVNPLVVAGVGFIMASIAYAAGFFLNLGVFASVAPLAVWILFAGLGVSGRPVKNALITSSIVALASNYVNIMNIVSGVISGSLVIGNYIPAIVLSSISFMAVVMSALWSNSKE